MHKSKIGSIWKLILLLIIPSAIFATFISDVAKNQAFEYIRQSQKEALLNVSEQINLGMKEYVERIIFVMIDIEQQLVRESIDAQTITDYMDTVARMRSDYIRGMVYLGDDGNVLGYPENYWGYFSEKEMDMINQQVLTKYPPIIWSDPYRSNIGRGGRFTPVSIVTKIVYNDQKERIGRLSIVLDLFTISNREITLAMSGYETRTLLYDQKGDIIENLSNSPDPQIAVLTSKKEIREFDKAIEHFNQNEFFYVVSKMDYDPGWNIITVGNIEVLENKFKPVTKLAMIVLLLGMAGFVCIYVIVAWWFTRPVISLIKGIRKVSWGDFDTKIEVRRKDEFGELANQFNHMTFTIKELIRNLKETEEKKRSTEFKVLLSQINPHFLYNTLNSIDIMIDISSKEDLHKIIHVLGSLLKYGLDQSGEQRNLRDELTNVNDYLYIQSIRYDNRFEFTIDEPEFIDEIIVLKLLLQPLVENALFHGLHPLTQRKGTLKILLHKELNKLVIDVSDNGVGMSEEKRLELEQSLQMVDSTSVGIGLRNVHQRIQLFYGEQYGISIYSTLNIGTTVQIKIPYLLKGME